MVTIIGNKTFINNMIITPVKVSKGFLIKIQGIFALKDDTVTRNHYEQLGWFLSICDRIAGYSVGDFRYANELARRNAIGMAPISYK